MFNFVENGIGETARNFRCVLLYSTPSFTCKILTPFLFPVPLIFPPTSSEMILSMPVRPGIFCLSLCVYGAEFVNLCPDLATVFLSAYAFHYGIIQAITPTELSLLSSARLLLEEFDEISRIMKDTKYFLNVPSLLSRNFCPHMIEYVEEYRSWEKNLPGKELSE
jgi:hypothetical protein